MNHGHRCFKGNAFGFLMLSAALLFSLSCSADGGKDAAPLRFEISFSGNLAQEAQDGRILLMLAEDPNSEPRFQFCPMFGINVDGLAPDEPAVIDGTVFGFPADSLADVPAGEYYVQALFNRYETFHRADGHSVKLPPDKGEGQQWNRKPGNFFSTPEMMAIDPSEKKTVKIVMDRQIHDFPEREDNKYIKHIRIQSDRLTEFWGRPMFLEAIIMLPEGFEEHPEARYPLMIYHGHHHRYFYTPTLFRDTPPDPGQSSTDRSDRAGYELLNQEIAYKFFKAWTGPDFPRMIIVTIQHVNPYYDDSYAVNSANIGPYGDAITYELIPYIEEHYRGIGEGWARCLYGGSTGGWEVLAAQIFYPDEYNGCWSFCPDPIDFRQYTIVNIYEHENAYYANNKWKLAPRPGARNYLGEVRETLEEANHRELVIATKGRSGGQWDVWQAVFSPLDDDGYPKPIWDKMTGEIDHEVAAYWRENYDLRYILERDWKTLGPKLKGKIHIYVGDMDNFYLNNAVYLMEDFLESTTDPYYGGEIDYGDRFEHCWSGDHDNPNSLSRLTINLRVAPKMMERILKSAPQGADLTSWRY